jgi:cbb3-type cytochrome oxidase maturation protein
MEIILVLIFFSIVIAGSFLLAFFWAVRNGQFDDQYTPSVRMLFEDKENLVVKPEKNESNNIH